MTQLTTSRPESDLDLTHQFVRLFGRDPSAVELQRYRRARARLGLRMPSRARYEAPRPIVRL